MGILNKLFKKSNSDQMEDGSRNFDKVDSFHQHRMELVRAYWNGSDNHNINNELNSILSSCKTRSEKLEKIAKLCEPAKTNEDLYYISKSYVWAGAQYRTAAIRYLLEYIEAGGFWEGLPDEKIPMDGYVLDQKASNISSAYADLAKCYEGEYEFDKALEAYQKAYELLPYSVANLIGISTIYIKKNNLDKALAALEEAKNSTYYNIPDFSDVVDRHIVDVKIKIEKGYVYKPKRKN